MYRKNFNQYCFTHIWNWLKWNLAIPFVIPIVYYYCILFFPFFGLNISEPIHYNIFEVAEDLFSRGVFILLGASLFFDIFVDFKEYRNLFSIDKVIFVILLLLFTGFAFIRSLGIINGLKPISFGWQVILILLCLFTSLIIKKSILTIKFKKEKYYGI